MKDKLVRTGHKKPYYRARAFAFALLAFLGSSAAAATPIAISYRVAAEPSYATVKEEEKEEAKGSEEEENEEALEAEEEK